MRSVAATLSCNDFASCSGVDLTAGAGGAAFFLFDNGLSNRLIILPIASNLSILFLTVPAPRPFQFARRHPDYVVPIEFLFSSGMPFSLIKSKLMQVLSLGIQATLFLGPLFRSA